MRLCRNSFLWTRRIETLLVFSSVQPQTNVDRLTFCFIPERLVSSLTSLFHNVPIYFLRWSCRQVVWTTWNPSRTNVFRTYRVRRIARATAPLWTVPEDRWPKYRKTYRFTLPSCKYICCSSLQKDPVIEHVTSFESLQQSILGGLR